MMKFVLSTSLLALGAVAAHAGGIERSHSPYAILWEKGNYAELSFGRIMPDVSGTGYTPVSGTLRPASSGNILEDYSQLGLGFKYAIRPDLDLAVVFDNAMGVDIAYPLGGQDGYLVPYMLQGSNAEITSNALTALLRYRIDQSWSVHGGLKIQRTNGNVDLPAVAYQMSTSTETDLGFVLGAAYEIPDIAMRVALTYQSEIKHGFDTVETVAAGPGAGTYNTTMDVTVPQSLTLDFQSGVAADTLVFGSVRWREWSAFGITPTVYSSSATADPQNPNNALVDYPRNVVTLTLGLGRKFTENFSGMVSIGYEKANDFRTSNLGPHNGMRSLTVGGSWTQDSWKISGGVTYAEIGDATTFNPVNGDFRDNKVVGLGVKVGYSF